MSAFRSPDAFTTRPDLSGRFGMAASTHATATAIAQSVLERGGNAFDAVVAGGFALHLLEPHLNGPGGDLVGVFRTTDGAPTILMGQGPVPAGATVAHLRGEGLDLVPGAGALAAAVPGAVDAWLLLLRDHGTFELADVLAYAIDLAREGAQLLPAAATTIARVETLFRTHWPTSAAQWLPGGAPPVAGAVIANPAYAALLQGLVEAASTGARRAERIDAARSHWRRVVGAAVETFVRVPHRHSTGGDHAGVITAADIEGFEAGYEPTCSIAFRGARVHKAGPWTQGPALLLALGMLEPLPDARLDPSSAEGAHTIIEALKLALADRDARFGDGADVDGLFAADALATRRDALGARASTSWRPSAGAAFAPPLQVPAPDAVSGAGEPTVDRSGQTRGDTCHIDVVDRWGNIVAVTPSGGWLQSSPLIPELGFCLGTRVQMCWLDEDAPSGLRPGLRPRTTLSPTLVERGDETWALGTPGGDQQDQWQLPALLRLLVGGYTPQQAIDAPMLHTTAMIDSFWPRTWHPNGVLVEDRLGDEVIEALIARGHDVTRTGDWSLGRLCFVGVDRRDGRVFAAANPRGGIGYAAGR